MSGKSSHEKGVETESIVLSRLKGLDAMVSIPWGRPRYDMIVDNGETIYRAQVKTARESEIEGSITFSCHSGHINSKGNKKIPYTKEEIDIFLVYSPKTDKVYWINVEETGSSKMSLRVGETSKYTPDSSVNFHEDYLLADSF